jgi:hypothetical protein
MTQQLLLPGLLVANFINVILTFILSGTIVKKRLTFLAAPFYNPSSNTYACYAVAREIFTGTIALVFENYIPVSISSPPISAHRRLRSIRDACCQKPALFIVLPAVPITQSKNIH